MEQQLDSKGVRYIVFFDKDEGTWYGVALEFNLVVDGEDLESTHHDLIEAIKGYVEGAVREGCIDVLSQEPAKEYEGLWQAIQDKGLVPSPYKVADFGRRILEEV